MLACLAAPLAAAEFDAKERVVRECAACHAEDGNSPAPAFPKLAGMTADYLAKQLNDVKEGLRKSAIMEPVAVSLKGSEIRALAGYFAAQRRTPGIVSHPELVARGEAIFHQGNPESGVPACAGCHLKDGRGAPRFPMVAAQHADYVLQQLQAFRAATRTNDLGKIMRTTVKRLTDEEMLAVAQYVASLPVPATDR